MSFHQVEENKLMGKFPGAKIRIESDFHFPAMGESGSSAAPNLDSSADAESVAAEEETDGDPGAAVSFAKMLRKPSSSSSKAAAAQSTEPQTKVTDLDFRS